jgi:cytoskeletal protein RodZ
MADIEYTDTHVSNPESDSMQEPENIPVLREEEDMGEVASMLKRAREERGLSFKDAETETRVPTHYLQILEGEGDSRLLADVLYLVPFLRTYSLFLGLDPAVTVPQFLTAVQKGDVLGSVPVTHARRSVSRKIIIALILIGLTALSFLWIAGEHG